MKRIEVGICSDWQSQNHLEFAGLLPVTVFRRCRSHKFMRSSIVSSFLLCLSLGIITGMQHEYTWSFSQPRVKVDLKHRTSTADCVWIVWSVYSSGKHYSELILVRRHLVAKWMTALHSSNVHPQLDSCSWNIAQRKPTFKTSKENHSLAPCHILILPFIILDLLNSHRMTSTVPGTSEN